MDAGRGVRSGVDYAGRRCTNMVYAWEMASDMHGPKSDLGIFISVLGRLFGIIGSKGKKYERLINDQGDAERKAKNG